MEFAQLNELSWPEDAQLKVPPPRSDSGMGGASDSVGADREAASLRQRLRLVCGSVLRSCGAAKEDGGGGQTRDVWGRPLVT
jgi:hypothetical protein